MKYLFHVLVCLLVSSALSAQITSPVIKANFGADADLQSNYFNGSVQSNDDWFYGTAGPGTFIIDTTGAAQILNSYATNPATKMQPFFRNMRYPQFSVVNNRILVDAIFIRDHHGDDSTVFASGSNKNGMSPASWTCPVSQGVPDKTDILDMMMHVRREGPNLTDSLWLFGGVSIENTTGNRYFDFEMYQTDIYYDKTTRTFNNYGPDAGHTAWQFDGAGNIVKAGDIIFTAEYSSSSLSNLEARIWVNSSDLSLSPSVFNWGGSFDGATSGATYGYANILPKTAGDFYTGLQCGNNTWAGPFQLVRQDNSLVTNYTTRQFMEFSVNLSKLGLDPLVTNNNPCGMPFRRILVKSRASTSFTAELKDFVGPFSFFRAPAANAEADAPILCSSYATSNITVTNPLLTSLYTWTTPDGHIVGAANGTSIVVDQAGSYIVSQELMDSCGVSYARDTVSITYDPFCGVLPVILKQFSGSYDKGTARLQWQVENDISAAGYVLEKSLDGYNFTPVYSIETGYTGRYNYTDRPANPENAYVYYRLQIKDINGRKTYSHVLKLNIQKEVTGKITISPNPVRDYLQVGFYTPVSTTVTIRLISNSGGVINSTDYQSQEGYNTIHLNNLGRCSQGLYYVQMKAGNEIYHEKFVLIR